VRKVLAVLGIAVVVIVGLLALQVLLTERDAPGVDTETARGPGTLLPDHGDRHTATPKRAPEQGGPPPASGPHAPVAVRADGQALGDDAVLHALEKGNVVLLYDAPRVPGVLRAVQRRVTGASTSPELVTSGQAVVLARRPGTKGVVALAWRHRLRAPSDRDPRVEEFASYWLGEQPAG
jgi:Protein of unknown function (DUF3105)